MGSQLIVKASPERLREIRDLLHQLDRPPRRLMLIVSNQVDNAHSAAGVSASAEVRTGDGQISINSPGESTERTGARIGLYNRDRSQVQTSRQQIQALEGRPAFIQSGEQIPVHERQDYYLQGIPRTRHSAYLRDVTRGFYAVPRVQGDLVTLEILQHADSRRPASGGFDIQRGGTTITGRLGEWIELGGVDIANTESSGGIARLSHTRDRRMQTIRVMVECLDCQSSGSR
jgi:hypothetical protein